MGRIHTYSKVGGKLDQWWIQSLSDSPLFVIHQIFKVGADGVHELRSQNLSKFNQGSQAAKRGKVMLFQI